MSSSKLAFLGGTGPEGMGLALRFAKAGYAIVIGSRSNSRAEEVVGKLKSWFPGAVAKGVENADAAKEGDIVFVTFPFEAQKDTLPPLKEHISGKILVSTVAPLKFEKGWARAVSVEEGSAAEQAQKLLPDTMVVSAFHNISADKLKKIDEPLDCDVVVCSDNPKAKRVVMELAQRIPNIRAIDGGALGNSRYVEDLTALLVNLNRIHKARTSIKIVGI